MKKKLFWGFLVLLGLLYIISTGQRTYFEFKTGYKLVGSRPDIRLGYQGKVAVDYSVCDYKTDKDYLAMVQFVGHKNEDDKVVYTGELHYVLLDYSHPPTFDSKGNLITPAQYFNDSDSFDQAVKAKGLSFHIDYASWNEKVKAQKGCHG